MCVWILPFQTTGRGLLAGIILHWGTSGVAIKSVGLGFGGVRLSSMHSHEVQQVTLGQSLSDLPTS